MKNTFFFFVGALLVMMNTGCEETKDPLFRMRGSDVTGLTFNNVIQPYVTDTFNSLEFEYIYNGAGVATADFNNDGLPDLYFGGNIVSSRLYLNKGNLKFEEVTAQSNTSTQRWVTGISVVDINNDGWDDIYACVAGKTSAENRANLLFISQGTNSEGIPVFTEEARAYGLADTGYSTMAAFFDYDKDGDLDVYLLTNGLESYNRNTLRPKFVNGEAANTDRLYRNNGDSTFTDVSSEAGILIEGWGLGVCIADLNQDGWPDVYVANDFVSNDLIWINQKDGTFSNKAGDYLQHQTHNGMGVDIADYNNDQLPDIVVLDMLPRDNFREKTMIAKGGYDYSSMQEKEGYQKQYMRNTLQLNQGKTANGELKFSEIGYMAGIFRTDWSWAPLLADFDNDGLKDLFVANGYRRDVTNLDFVNYNDSESFFFGTEESKKERLYAKIDSMPEVKIHNFIYRNRGDLTFEDVSEEWGMDAPSYSNGAIYADLDNDGDLDIVTNNIDDEVMLFENLLYQADTTPAANYLRVELIADGAEEIKRVGAKVLIAANGKKQYVEYTPYRGYKSTVEPFLHFGLGRESLIDTVLVIWPDQRVTRRYNVAANQVLKLSYAEAEEGVDSSSEIQYASGEEQKRMFEEKTLHSGLDSVAHKEKVHIDFKNTPMLHRQLSMDGPYLAVGDLNGDGLDDVVMGADEGFATKILWQQPNRTFVETSLPFDSVYEDRGILIFDADNDSFNDIYIVSGGSQFPKGDSWYQDRLYLNTGDGVFTDATAQLPPIVSSGSVVKGADYDQDGDIDLFVGGRLIPGEYPLAPGSYILQNEGGVFRDVTRQVAPDLESVGLVTDAVWFDYDNNSTPDLVVVGEWMPVRIFANRQNSLVEVTSAFDLEKTNGWYHTVQAADLNRDGYLDLIVGNNGLNSYYQASPDQPLEIFAKDFDQNGSFDPILTHYNQGERYISFFRDQLTDQIVGFKKRFKRYEQFARSTFSESFTGSELRGAHHEVCYELASFILQNEGGTSFITHQLPAEAQLSNIKSISADDLDGDGHVDLLMVGNSFAEESVRGRYDASYGFLLKGNSSFDFKPLKPAESGLVADKDTRMMVPIEIKGKKHYILSRNNGRLSLYALSAIPLSIAKGDN